MAPAPSWPCRRHDERDHAFAKKYALPIIEVVSGGADVQKEPYTADGKAVNSANAEVSLNGLGTAEAKSLMIAWLVKKQHREGRGAVQAARLALFASALLG